MTEDEILAQLPFRRTDAEIYDCQQCWKCKEYIIWLPYDHAVFAGHVYTQEGLAEVNISGVCEYCFDEMFGE